MSVKLAQVGYSVTEPTQERPWKTVKQKWFRNPPKPKEKPMKTSDQNAQKTSVQTARRQESDTWKTEYTET